MKFMNKYKNLLISKLFLSINLTELLKDLPFLIILNYYKILNIIFIFIIILNIIIIILNIIIIILNNIIILYYF